MCGELLHRVERDGSSQETKVGKITLSIKEVAKEGGNLYLAKRKGIGSSMFITFEGLDFSGKTTQANLLVHRLEQNGRSVLFLREPGGTKISEQIRLILLNRDHTTMDQVTELLLFSASRSQLVSEVILPALKEGKVVVCDRFADSTVAYQGWGRGLNLEAVKTINAVATFGLVPDLTFFLDLPLKELRNRAREGGEERDRLERSGEEFYDRVRRGYLASVELERKRFVVVDGSLPVQQIHERVWKVATERIPIIHHQK